jgi:hypothetical protein
MGGMFPLRYVPGVREHIQEAAALVISFSSRRLR